MMLTNGEHDDLWRKAANAIQALDGIAYSLKRSNGLTIAREMFDHGMMDEDCYQKFLTKLFNSEGFYFDY